MKALPIALAGLIFLATSAHAQTGRRISLGLGVGAHSYSDKAFHQASPGLTLVDRLGSGSAPRDGWRFSPRLSASMYRTDVRVVDASATTHVGRLQSVPILVGAGPTYRHGRTQLGIGVLAGPSFHHYTADPNFAPIHMRTSLVVKPEASLWYDVSSRLGLRAGVAYIHDRPSTAVDPGSNVPAEHWKTDHVDASVGFAIGIL